MKWCEHSLTTCTYLETSTYFGRKGEELLLKNMHRPGGTQQNTVQQEALDSAALFVLVSVLSFGTQLTVLQYVNVVVTSCLFDCLMFD